MKIKLMLLPVCILSPIILLVFSVASGASDVHHLTVPNGAEASPYNIQRNVPGETSSEWELVDNLSDEFNGSKISNSKWITDVCQFDGPWSWDPSNVMEAGGNLNITMRQDRRIVKIPNKDRKPVKIAIQFTSGILKSKTKMIFGYYEARIQGVPTFPGSSPAFWLYSNAKADISAGLVGTKDGDTAYSEVDVVEMEQEKSINKLDMHGPYQIMKNGRHVFVRRKDAPYTPVKVSFDPRDAFHTYGVMVSRESLTYYVDGIEVLSQPNTHWNHLPMNVALSLGLRAPNSTFANCPDNLRRCPTDGSASAAGYPTTMKVDWVRVYKRKS